MSSVTAVVRKTKQPKNGYLPIKSFEVYSMYKPINRNNENVHPSLVGLAVDYLFRLNNKEVSQSLFFVALEGANILDNHNVFNGIENNNQFEYVKSLIDSLNNDLSDLDIIKVIEIASYDPAYRAGVQNYTPFQSMIEKSGFVNKITLNNIRFMVTKMIQYFQDENKIIETGSTFTGGYGDNIQTGDCDFLSKDTLWDLKVSKYEPKKEDSLQLLIYYVLGYERCRKISFEHIKYLGIYNQSIGKVYKLEIAKIDKDLIGYVDDQLIQ
ncbi:hypothetical protein JM47_01550 [Ureaplasma diversum]|uniref:PD-(D/E)XK endonuclease-like domain-containing protein n=1 Tax=Ureaplasma diversum TaxID=42094 RepID=A0A0C5RKW7_9BACT|nr:hypothetical protein [Ureaplasma diversum]AJQ45293.1 hypothetical protein JM47_01550 [Ureaplasma diversum]